MHLIKKAYCRTYQTCFRLALPILPYRKPEILEHLPELPAALRQRGITKVLLVTDAQIRGAGLTARMEEELPAGGVTCVVYDKTCPNPTIANVEEALALYKQEECQGLLAFGGGSSIDCAKGVGARIANPKKTLSQMRGILKVHHKLPLLAAIPTTAGTGSEVTPTCVVTDEKTHYKYPISDFPMIPRIAVLEPHVTFTLPKSLTATTGMDALTHAVEAFIGRSTTRETRHDAIRAVQLIFKSIETAYAEPENLVARANMLEAAYLAGNAFSQSYVGYVHAVAHSLGGAYGIAHGLANTVLLPIVLEAYGTAAHKKLKRLAIAVGLATDADDDAKAAAAFIAEVRAMNTRMNVPETLTGIREEDIPVLAKQADVEANPLYPVPVEWNAKELERLYYAVMEKGE